MTTDEMRIAIAEVMGWTWEDGLGDYVCGWISPEGFGRQLSERLNGKAQKEDYTHLLPALTLDWMHEVEKALNDAERCVYAETLCAILKGAIVDWGYYPGESEIDWHSISSLIFATALQRAEAFLRVKGLWKEEWR